MDRLDRRSLPSIDPGSFCIARRNGVFFFLSFFFLLLFRSDGRYGLSTKGAATAHYATLRLDNTWDRSHKYCASVGGSLCKVSQICPKGKGHKAVGAKEIPHNRRSWSPVADAPNMWVNMEPGQRKLDTAPAAAAAAAAAAVAWL
jgi:hypothetical protein